MTRRDGRRARTSRPGLPALVALLASSLTALLALGCAEVAEEPAVATELDSAAAEIVWPGKPRPDWYHILTVLEELRAQPPADPLVVLFGGSSGRECTVSDASWAAEVHELGGPAVVAHNLSSRNKTFRHDLDLVRLLPRREAPTLVFIGVNLSRFTQWTYEAGPGPATVPDHVTFAYEQHSYAGRPPGSPEEKRRAVETWLDERLAVFESHVDDNAAMLAEVVRSCRARGYEPVLLELPRDREAIGALLDEPVARYQEACVQVAAEQGIAYVDFVADVGLESADFYDVWHLVDSGYVKWQRALAQSTADMLAERR